MSQRQQLLLQQLGIQQWIVRAQYVERKNLDSLWRDQHEVEDATFHVPQNLSLTAQDKIAKTQAIQSEQQQGLPVQTLYDDVYHHNLPSLHKTISVDIDQTTLAVQPVIQNEAKPVSQNISFDYQVVLHDKFLILAESNDSTQRKLLHHIQNACFAEQSHLKWPLNIQSWDSEDQLVHSYLQGFFAIHRSKLIIILGEDELLPSLCADQFQQFNAPSLQQMIETPTQKRLLWQKIYPLIYDIEQNDEKESRDL